MPNVERANAHTHTMFQTIIRVRVLVIITIVVTQAITLEVFGSTTDENFRWESVTLGFITAVGVNHFTLKNDASINLRLRRASFGDFTSST